jgi:glycosyltransferase involved in cell wall biosynthesis
VLLEALSMLKACGVEFCCTLVGDGPLRSESEAQTRELGLDERVHFAGALAPAAVVEEYNRADVCVLASLGEGIPLTLTEALAFGRPVVATSVGGVPELVEPGVTGYLVPPNSPSELADALKRVLEQPELARKMGERGREKVRTDYNVERATARLAALLQERELEYRK